MSDLTAKEQDHVRAAIRFLRVQFRTWEATANLLACRRNALHRVNAGSRGVTAGLAFRVARIAGVGVDALLSGAYPPAGVCPHCGHSLEADEPIRASTRA